MRPIFDGHLDLALFALAYNRDQTEDVALINQREAHMHDAPDRGGAVVSLPEMRRARVFLCQSTVAARTDRAHQPAAGHARLDLDFGTQAIAYAYAQGQLAYYRALEQAGEIRLVASLEDLEEHWCQWRQAPPDTPLPVGLIISMECADPILKPDQAAAWWADGLRSVSLAHFGTSQYSGGTGTAEPLTDRGFALLQAMQECGLILDLTHTAEPAFYQALDHFSGPVLASHTNCRALVPGDRQFSDDQLRRLIARDAVIGTALDAWMLVPGFIVGQTEPGDLSLTAAADHIDHVCQLAGTARHAALGTDTGATYHMPADYRTSADLHRLEQALADKGYGEAEIDAIFHGNWLRFFRRWLPSQS